MAVDPRQNWLLVSFDQWRGDWLEQPWLRLPHLQSLLAGSWWAQTCITNAPQCVPARASCLTGLWPSELGLARNQPFVMPADAPSFVRNLHERGYYTALIGKTHWTPHHQPADLRDNQPLMQALGFDRVREIAGPRALVRMRCDLTDLWDQAGVMEAYRTDLAERYAGGRHDVVRPSVLPDALYPDLWLGEQAAAELAALPQDQPWLLWVSFCGPHEPFDVPEAWRNGAAAADAIPQAQDCPAWADRLPADCVLAQRLQQAPALNSEILRAIRADYADHLALLDAQLGRLLQALAARSDQGRTAITVISDHGELLGDWGLLLKGCFLEGAVRSLFVHRPAPEQPLRSCERVSHPLNLTQLLWAVQRGVVDGSATQQLRDWASQNQEARSEFGGELLIARPGERWLHDRQGHQWDLSDQRP
jgi:arylsulfatase